MEWAGGQFLRRIGLSSRGGNGTTPAKPVVLTGSAADEKSGLIVSLHSTTNFDKAGNPQEVGIKYWRHLPFGQSLDQNLIRVTFKPSGKKGDPAQLDQVWVQSRQIFNAARGDDSESPEMKKKIQCVLEAVTRVNSLLREGAPVEGVAKIFEDCNIAAVTGEDVVIRGLDAKQGGFSMSYLRPEFMRAAANSAARSPMQFNAVDRDTLKTALGFRINSIEPDKNFDGSRETETADPQSGVLYNANVNVKETAKTFEVTIGLNPQDAPEGTHPLPIANLAKVSFGKNRNGSYELTNAMFMDQKLDPADTKSVLSLLGFIQKCNRDFSQWKFPSFMNHAMQHDMHDKTNALPTPKSLKEGGEMNYLSLHGCGSEKRIENFGDQIGIAAVFLQRGTKEDGTVSTVGVAIDFPFATGGPDSSYDGAVPNYLPFLKDISHFFITHKHFDHKGGIPYYAIKGLLKGKTIVCTEQVRYKIEEDFNNFQVPRHMRPEFQVLDKDKDGAIPIEDIDGNTRMWVQYSPNATLHSTFTTPYIVTGCYNDDHYNGSAIVYGDSSGQTERSRNFYKDIRGSLVDQARNLGYTVSPEKIPFKPFVFHDTTAVRYEGRAPLQSEFIENLTKLVSLFRDRGLVIAPISTNDAEYQGIIQVAHNTRRDMTAVGSSAEVAMRLMNIFGVRPETDISKIRIDPFEEWEKPESERLIPGDILEAYMGSLSYAAELCGKDKDECNLAEMKRIHKKEFAQRIKNLPSSQAEHTKNVETYMLRRLRKDGAVTFDDNVNGRLMLLAILEKRQQASVYAGRRSQVALDMRSEPKTQLIVSTGTQGTAEEKASTVQKVIDRISLLDVDERVRGTGYKIDMDKYGFIITQSAIPGNETSQEDQVKRLAENRKVPVAVAYLNGFRIHNPGKDRDFMISQMTRFGWKHKVDQDGSITVTDCPIHINGHGFKLDLLDVARGIPAELHIPHHIPDYDSHDIFMQLMDDNNLPRPKEKSDDFKLYEIDGHAANKDDKFKCIGHIDPSYILVSTLRRYGLPYGGTQVWEEATLLRREGNSRAEGLMARSDNQDVYRKKTSRVDFETMADPARRQGGERHKTTGPSPVDRDRGYRRPRSRKIWSIPMPEDA